jgi:cysteine desulfurase/selenocysteine lyase
MHYKNDFPMLRRTMHGKPLVYLDSAATAQKPQVVIDAMTRFYEEHYATVHRAVYQLAAYSTAAYQNARSTIQRLLNAAKPEEIIFTSGGTESLNLAAHCCGKGLLARGDEVLLSVMEHHSNIVPWQIACAERGARLRVIPMNDCGELLLDDYAELLNDRTKIVAITHMSNVLGTINPIKEMIAMAHAKDAVVLVDGAQSVPHMPVDVQDLDADFYALSGHKAYGPTGIGVLYGKEALLNALPPYKGGGDMIDTVTFEKTTYNDLPMKYEAGTPLIVQAIGLGAAVEYLEKIGLKNIQEREHQLLLYAQKKLSTIKGLRLIGTASHKGAIISFVVDGAHSLDIGTLLDLRGIAVRTGHTCAQPLMQRLGIPGVVRVSLAFYNTETEIDYLVDSLNEILPFFYH